MHYEKSSPIIPILKQFIFCRWEQFVVRKIDLNTGIITTVVGQGNYTHNGDGGQAILANLQFPRGVVFDNVGNMYISEKPYIRKVDLNGVIFYYYG